MLLTFGKEKVTIRTVVLPNGKDYPVSDVFSDLEQLGDGETLRDEDASALGFLNYLELHEGLKKIPRQGGHYAYEVTDRAKFHRWYDDLLNEYLDEMKRDPIKEKTNMTKKRLIEVFDEDIKRGIRILAKRFCDREGASWDAGTATVTTYRNPGRCLMDLMTFLDEEGPGIYVLRDYIHAMGDPVLELDGTVTRIRFPELGVK